MPGSRSADETPRRHAVERGGWNASTPEVREAARRLAEHRITPGQLYFVLDLFLPDGWETEALQDALRNSRGGVLSAGEVLAWICSAASRDSQALVLRETSAVGTPALGPSAARQTHRITFVQERGPRLLGEDVCEICGRNYAVPGLGDVECWECYSEH